MSRFVQAVLLLPPLIEERPDRKKVVLQYNAKDVELMVRLRAGLKRINKLGFRTPNGKQLHFEIAHQI